MKYSLLAFVGLVTLLTLNPLSAATYYTKNAGDWSAGGRWGSSCGAGAGSTPGPADTAVICDGYTMTLDGNLTGASSIGNIIIQGGGTLDTSAANNYSLTVDGALTLGDGTTAAGTAALIANASTISVGGNLTIGDGAGGANAADLQANAANISLQGNLTIDSDGTYTHATSTFALNAATGTQAVNGANPTTFYNLQLTASASARTITFQAGETITVTNAFSAAGTAGQLLTINTNTGSGAWTLNGASTKSGDYLHLYNSTALGANTPVLPTNSTNGGGNSGWFTAPAATQVVLTTAGSDFAAGGSTSLTVQVRDAGNSLVAGDNTTTVTFTPTLSGAITGVTTGTGDASYGVVGGAETVTVAGGIATITLSDNVAETFEVAFTNGGGLTNPANDSIVVNPGAATQVVLTQPGLDFNAGGTTTLTLQVQDANGNTVVSDNTTTITLTPNLSGTISTVIAGTGDGGYGAVGGAETITVANGIVSVQVTNTIGETFLVNFTNSGGLSNPADDSITVLGGTGVVATASASSIAVGDSITITIEVRDGSNSIVTADNATIVTVAPTSSGAITAVNQGTGDGSYGAAGTPEAITVASGVGILTIRGETSGTLAISFTNNAGLANPAVLFIEVEQEKARGKIIAAPSVFDARKHTTMRFIGLDGHGTMAVYTIRGRKLFSTNLARGAREYEWNVATNTGRSLSSGVYVVVFNGGNAPLQRFRIIVER